MHRFDPMVMRGIPGLKTPLPMIPGADIMGVQTSVNMAILERFNAEQLEFAFPTQTIHTLAG